MSTEMVSPLRFDAPGTLHHVWASGVGPSAIYLDEGDMVAFRSLSADVFDLVGVTCLQYCLMTTHYHFLLRSDEGCLSAAMQRINAQYARSFNLRCGRRGHVFGSRFGSKFVQTQPHLLVEVRYIALNPLDIPGCEHPLDWPFSSYANTVFERADPLADTAALLELVGGAAKLRAFVEDGLPPRRASSGDVSFTSPEETEEAA